MQGEDDLPLGIGPVAFLTAGHHVLTDTADLRMGGAQAHPLPHHPGHLSPHQVIGGVMDILDLRPRQPQGLVGHALPCAFVPAV